MAGDDGGWDFLFGKTIPFKAEMHIFAWHLPGILCAFAIGLMANWLLEETLKLVSKRVAEHALVTVTWVALVIYIIFFSGFDNWLAYKIHWYKICPPPARYSRTVTPAPAAR